VTLLRAGVETLIGKERMAALIEESLAMLIFTVEGEITFVIRSIRLEMGSIVRLWNCAGDDEGSDDGSEREKGAEDVEHDEGNDGDFEESVEEGGVLKERRKVKLQEKLKKGID
jgi:hypothetical protein